MPVTASVLYNFVHCPKRIALDEFGDQSLRDPLNPFVRLLWERARCTNARSLRGLISPISIFRRTSARIASA